MGDPESVLTAIVEDHPLFRAAIAAVVESMPGLRLGPVIADATETMDRLAEDPPGLVLIDYSLDGTDAPELIEAIRDRWPEARCLVLSGHLDAAYAQRSMEAGASGYILKGRPDDFDEATAAILAGGTYVSAVLASD